VDRHKLLRVVIAFMLGVSSALSALIPSYADAGCSMASSWVGACTGAQANSSSVDVWGSRTTPGESATPDSPGTTGTNATTGNRWNPPEVPFSFVPQHGAPSINSFCELVLYFGGARCPETPAPAPTPPPISPVTLSDLENFIPEQPSLAMQPNGWTVIGVETNFIANTSQHVVGGKLFGALAEVRFTPQAFDWSYGDGTQAGTTQPGATWTQLGVKEFSRTATSHRYQSLGSFITEVTVRFGVEYRVGGGTWTSIRGQVSAHAPAATVIVQSADTVLVTGACTPGRSALGC
jgi:hypothetical protein